MRHTILLIDDDLDFANSMKFFLDKEGYDVTVVDCPILAIEHLHILAVDMLLLDLEFERNSGMDVIKFLNGDTPGTMTIMVSNSSNFDMRIEALQVGADDFMIKPFHPQELLVRIEKLLCRKYSSRSRIIHTKYFDLDILSGKLTTAEKSFQLRRKEFEILTFLIENKNIIITKNQILHKIWSIDDTPQHATIDVHIRRLRLQLKDRQKTIIRTAYGSGYMFYEPG